jgi:DNA polymerase III subunit delta'
MAQLLKSIYGNSEIHQRLLEVAQKGRLASTLLFVGPAGIGKKQFARALAQALVCSGNSPSGSANGGAEACGECGPCLRVEKGQSESLLYVEPDGAQIKIEQARDILQFLALQRLGRSRVVIIDQAHLLNVQAANALLKSLEEPPEGTYFILLTHLADAVLPTIRSRSQLIRFRPLSDAELAQVLGSEAEPWIIEASQGSVEAAQGFLASRDDFRELDRVCLEFLTTALVRFPADQISELKELTKDRSAQTFMAGVFQGCFRNALRIQAGLPPISSSPQWKEVASSIAGFDPRALGKVIDDSLLIGNEMARNIERGLLLENFALRIADLTRASGDAEMGGR